MSAKEPSDVSRQDDVAQMTRWSWLMVPAFVLVYVLTSVAYQWLLQARGQSEGDLFAMTEDVAGVALEAAFAMLLAVPPVLGLTLAVRALRRRSAGWAWAAAAVNALLLVLVVYQFSDAIRMSFFAPLD